MSKTIQHFLFGFGTILDIFQPIEKLNLSRGGFAEDRAKLSNDVNKVKKDFSKVVYGKRQNQGNR